MPSVCLVMVVRDEEEIIGRALASALPLVDRCLVVDAGSTDRTMELVATAVGSANVVQRPWRGFGPSRTEALALAEGLADWCLMLDADQTLEGTLEFPEADAAAVHVVEAGTFWRLPRLTRSGRPWRYLGATHEFLEVAGAHVVPLDSLRIIHHADGSSRANKLERDRQLLLDALRADPFDSRSSFYLAQTYRDLGAARTAAVWYQRRADMGGWEEERWYAQFQAALMLQDEDALAAAWGARPWRPEPAYHLAVMARSTGRPSVALHWSSIGAQADPSGDSLFVERWLVEWGLPFEQAVAQACLGSVEEAAQTLQELLADRRMPEAWREAARQNLETLGVRPAGVA